MPHRLTPEQPGSLSCFGPGTLEMEELLDEPSTSVPDANLAFFLGGLQQLMSILWAWASMHGVSDS